jgi:hypothetical protein
VEVRDSNPFCSTIQSGQTDPVSLKGCAANKVATKLIAAGPIKEVKAKAGMPVSRRDEQYAQSYAFS